MTIAPISLGSGSNPSKYAHGGATRHVNCYIEKQGEDAKSPTILLASDGLTELVTLDTEGVRAAIAVGEYVYAVYGATMYRIAADGTNIILGGIPESGPVYIARNRRDYPQVAVVCSETMYVYDTQTGSYTEVTGPSDFLPKSLVVVDGYGILPVTNSKWYITAIDDFTTINGLDFAKAESNPDELVAPASRESEVVLFGQRSIEWWANTGGADFPFTRSQAIELGCLSAGSVCNVDRTLIWIAHDATVRIMQGYDGKVISNHAVVRAIQSVEPETITSTTWEAAGHTFYCISSPSWTWVYDLATGSWHERQSEGSRWIVGAVVRLGRQLMACDSATGDVYEMSPDAFDEVDTELIMTVQTPPVTAFPYRVLFNALHIDIVPGVGLATGDAQDIAPELMVSWSDNGGSTWNIERRVPLGRQGDTIRRAIVRRLGVSPSHGRTFKFSISARVAKALLGASVDIEKLSS